MGDKGSMSPLREQDRFLPIANVARIMKTSIPKTGKVGLPVENTMIYIYRPL